MLQRECLKFGQVVSISPLENQSLCIYSDGLIKVDASLVETTPETLAAGSLYYSSLYRIYPSFVTSRLNQALHFENIDDGSKRMQKIKEIQQKIIVEYKMNIESIQKMKDQPISFNNNIQFLHYPTNRFLALSVLEAKEEKENFQLELSEFPSSRTTFQLQPAFTHQQSSEALIFPGDSVYIACAHIYQGIKPRLRAALSNKKMQNQEYMIERSLYAVPNVKILKKLAENLHSALEAKEATIVQQRFQKAAQLLKESSKPQLLRRQTTMIAQSELKMSGDTSEVNISLEKKSPWVLNAYSNQTDLEQIISFNDLIWIHHIEESSLISLGRNQDSELIITFTLMQPTTEFEGDSNGMFQVEHENMKLGGPVEWSTNIRLRHFILGKYLAINYEPIQSGQLLLYLSDSPGYNTLFQFVPVPTMGQSSQKYATKDSFMKLRTGGKKNQWVHIETRKILQQNSKYKDTITEEDKMVLVVRLTDHTEDEDVLKLYKANYSEVIEANFLITCFPVLRKSLTELKAITEFSEENKQKIMKTLDHLSQTTLKLEKFCNNQLINTQLDVKNAKVAIIQRQKILREQYFIDLLIEIMKYITNEDELKQYHEYEIQLHKASLEKNNTQSHRISSKQKSKIKDSISPLRQGTPSSSIKAIASSKMVASQLHAQSSQGTYNSKQHKHSHHHTSHKQKQFLVFLQEKMNVLKIIYRLLRSICQENPENQSYLYHLFPHFIYQIKYFKEATDCIITVLNGNDQILINLCDTIKLNEKIKAREIQQDSDESQISDEVEVQFHSSVDDKKSILLYYKSLTEESSGQRNIQYLQFFRCICRLNGDSISVNQEMIFKFMKQNDLFKQALFMPIIIEDKKMKIYVDPTQISYLASIKDPLIKQYLIEQLFLYADLAYQRNFLWKSYLERIFPTKFIFDQIFDNQIFDKDPELAIKYRSAFCNIALTVYVDHEPFNQALVPNLCRLYTETKPIKKTIQSSEKLKKLATEYCTLVDSTFNYLDELCSSIDKDLDKKFKTKLRAQQVDEQPVTNQLVLDIVRLISIMIRFDMLKIMNKQKNYQIIVPKLIKLLEYDKNNLLYPFILFTIRQNNIQKAKDNQAGLGVIKNVAGALNLINNTAKALTNSILGIPPKQQESLEDEFSEYDTAVIARNPIIGSLITITNQLDAMATSTNQSKNNQSAFNFDAEIQKEICGILLYFQDQRQDFYVSNFIQFYKQFTQKQQVSLDNTLQMAKFKVDLESDLVQVLPQFLTTGIETIDKQTQDQIDGLYKQDMNELMAVGGLLNQSKKFTKLIPDLDVMPDLDKLMAGEHSEIMEAQILPSILISFYITTDFSLQNKLVELLRRGYGQTTEMFYHLQRIELLFEEEEIRCYQFLESSISELKIITECSEVWLVDFLAKPDGEVGQIQKILKLLADITFLLREGTYIDHKGRVVQQGNRNGINSSRQKIFNFLNAFQPLVNFVRDTQQQLVKVLDDNFYTNETKDRTTRLLRSIFKCLADFCYQNNENQSMMHQYSSLFLDELQHNFGQMELLSAIYKDNKMLCQKISDQLLRKIQTFIYAYGRQARFLNLYKSIQTYKGNPITEMQTKVLQLFIPQHIGVESYTDINEFYLFGNFEVIDGHKCLEFTFEKAKEDKLLDQPYLYHSEILQVLLQTIVGEESFKVNSPKLKKLFKLHYLMELLLLEDDFLSEEAQILEGLEQNILDSQHGIKYIKPQLIDLINLLYVNNKVTDLFLFIREQQTFARYFQSEKNRLIKVQALQGDYTSYFTYFFDSVIVLMRYYSEKLIVKDANQEFKERDDYQQLYEVMHIIHAMSATIIQNKLQPPQYNNLVKFIYSLDEQMFRINAGQFSMSLEQKEILKSPEGEETIFTKKHNQVQTPLIKRSENQNEVDQLIQENYIDWNSKKQWNYFLELCQNLPNAKKTQQIEMRMLTNCFLEAHKFIPEVIIKELGLTIQFKDFLKKLIRFVEIGIISKADKINLMFALQILEDILDSKENLEEMQNQFDSCQGTRMFLNLLADFQTYPFDDDLLQQLFKYALKLSKNGNQRIQATVYNYFSNFEKSELIFLKMYQIIYEVINENKSRQQLMEQQQIQQDKDQQQQQLFLSNVKETHQEDSQTLRESNETRQNKMTVLIYCLKYLQLICEGHNLEIQNYLRYQFNSRNNYNIVQAMVELLCAFENDLQKDAFEVVMNTLETLTELVQGPCSQNQQDIIDSQFLEVASNYLNMHIDSKKKKQQDSQNDDGSQRERSNSLQSKSTAKNAMKTRTPQIDRWMLERLKYKCMVLVSSLLELNSDTSAIKRILRSLPINVLRNNLITIYKKHEKMYKKIGYNKESLGHLNANPHDSEQPSEYHELILETGFLIYFLINHYANLDNKEIDPQTRDELEEIKESQKESEKPDPWAELQNSLIGQLASLVFSLVGGILELINDWREEIQKQVMKTLKVSKDSDEVEKRKAQKKLAFQRAFSDSIKFFAKNSATIEVIRNGKIENIIFYKLSFCNYLPKESKTEFQDTVDRDSTNSKVSELVEITGNYIEVCKHEEDLTQFFNRNKFVALFAKYVILWKDLSFLLTLILNLFVILSFYEGESDDPDEKFRVRLYEPQFLKKLSVQETQSIFTYCGIGMMVCSTFVVLFFILKKGPLYVREAWNSSQDLLKEDQIWIIRFLIKIYMVGFCLIKVLLNIDMIYYLSYGVLAFIATLVHPFFFAFHLSEVVLRYPTLRNIIKSFWEPKAALGLTFVLVLLMNYYFSLVAYMWFSDIYDNNKCESLLVCFLSTFDYAFKNNGGIGGWFDGSQPQQIENYDYGRFMFDQLNNIMIQMISIQIFSGIIIDTFGELREQQLQKDEDKDNICFICGLDREIFDMKQDDGFRKHIKHSHYMWNYVYYMSYLDNKNKSEFNGIETYISTKLKNQDNSWFPIGQSLELQEELEDQEALEDKKMNIIQEKMESIRTLTTRVNQILADIDEIKSK